MMGIKMGEIKVKEQGQGGDDEVAQRLVCNLDFVVSSMIESFVVSAGCEGFCTRSSSDQQWRRDCEGGQQ